MLYQLEKWYFDFLTQAGDYFFGYFAHVTFLGTRTSELALHLRRSGSEEPVKWSGRLRATVGGGDTRTVDIDSGRISVGPAASTIAIDLPEATVRLEYAAQPITDPGLAIAARRGSVLWQPVMLGARVRGEAQLRGRTIVASDVRGYVDFLRSTELPPSVPIRTLFWGRALDARCAITYTHAAGVAESRASTGPPAPPSPFPPPQGGGNRREGASGSAVHAGVSDGTWSRLVVRTGESVLVATDVTVEPVEWQPSPELGIRCPARYLLTATGPGLRAELDVIHDRAAVESKFITGSPLLRRITRNPRGVKFTGRAVAHIKIGGKSIHAELPLVDEYAIFD